MEKQVEVIKRILELSQTGLEGLEYIKKRAMSGHFEETVDLFKDVFQSFNQINKAIQSLPPELENNDTITSLSASLIEGFKLMLAAYKKEGNIRPLEVLQFTLIPCYQKWQSEIDKKLGKYTTS